jgi:hypothetical protein
MKEDETMKVSLKQSINYHRARREIAELNLKMAYYNSTQAESDKRLDMLELIRIQEMKVSGKEVAEFADSQLIARGIDPQHLSTHAKAEALYGDIVDMQLSRMMEGRNKTIRNYMSFQHKELAADSFTVESMTKEEMEAYHGKERFGVTLIIDGEEIKVEEKEEESDDKEADKGATEATETAGEESAAEGASEGKSAADEESPSEQDNNSSEQTLAMVETKETELTEE